MSVSRTFDQPFYVGGTATVSQSGTSPFDVVINGRGYMLDLQNPAAKPYAFQSIPLLRNIFLQDRGANTLIGEHSLNPDDYWRRSLDDWSGGEGELVFDAPSTTTFNRYLSGKGVDPWTVGRLKLLSDTTTLTSGNYHFLKLAVAGTRLYLLANVGGVTDTFDYTTDLATFSFVNPAGGQGTLTNVRDLTSDGFTVWANDATRIYYTTRTGTTYTKWNTSDEVADLIRAVKGRFISTNGPAIRTHTFSPGSSVASTLFTHANTDWQWTDCVGGPDAIYFCGYSGGHSDIYACTIKSDATTLDAPQVVASLPEGEVAHSLCAYLGTLVVGTDKGWRIAALSSGSMSLSLGALVTMTNPPLCFEPQDRFVWYGWTNYDGTSTGLGRMDLSTFNETTPAYASDLMATTQGTVSSAATFGGKTVFAVEGSAGGIFAQSANLVASGSFTTGDITYDLADAKVAIKCNVQYRAGKGTIAVAVDPDDGGPRPVGDTITTSSVQGDSIMVSVPQLVAHAYQLTFTLGRNPQDATEGPVLDRMTFMVLPKPERRFTWVLPLLLHSSVQNRLGARTHYDAVTERALYENLLQSAEVVPLQDVEQTYLAVIEDLDWVPYEVILPDREWAGTLVLTMKQIS